MRTLSIVALVVVSLAFVAAGVMAFIGADGTSARLLASALLACGIGLIALGPFVALVKGGTR